MGRGLVLFVAVCIAPLIGLACFGVDFGPADNPPGTGPPTNQQRCEEAGGMCLQSFLGQDDDACPLPFASQTPAYRYNGINCGPGAGLCCVPLDSGTSE